MSRNPNPYAGVNWEKVTPVTGCTHMHCTTQKMFDDFVAQGLEFATFSNYYPSAPWYPLADIRENTFRISQNGCVKDGKIIREKIDFAPVVAQWDKELAAKLPAEPGEPVIKNIPGTLLEAPNAEHHWFSDHNVYLHICAPGSFLATSHFDRKHEFGLHEHGYALGCPTTWKTGLDAIFDALMIPDGGGAVIAHPHWSHLPISFMMEVLDYDPRVLGIEVFNYNNLDYTENAEVEWDHILASGRQCFGFFVEDHTMECWKGKCILLPEERTAEACLRAYRQGRFYGAILGNGFKFEHISFDGRTLRAKCNKKMIFQLTSAQGVVMDGYGSDEFVYQLDEKERDKHVFLRLTASDHVTREKLYAQPFMLVN